MEPRFFQRHPKIKDILDVIFFCIAVGVTTIVIHLFFIQTFNVVGPSMQSTLYTGDRLIVNRFATTWQNIQGRDYTPKRGEIIVFKNPNYIEGNATTPLYIVKRTIAFSGERVTVKDGVLKVYNTQHPEGFDPTEGIDIGTMATPVSGDVDMVVPGNEVFVVGDHRVGNFSDDSRSDLGTVPLYDIIGPAVLRIWPFEKIGGLPH